MDVINIYNTYMELRRKTGEEYVLVCNPSDFESELHFLKNVEIKQDRRCPVGIAYIMQKKDVLDEI